MIELTSMSINFLDFVQDKKNQLLTKDYGSFLSDKFGYIRFGYCDYGGTALDRANISFIKKNYEKNMIHENTAYDGEEVYLIGLKNEIESVYTFLFSEYPLFDDEELFELDEGLKQIAMEEIKSDSRFCDIDGSSILDWLSFYGQLKPNSYNYSQRELEEYFQSDLIQ